MRSASRRSGSSPFLSAALAVFLVVILALVPPARGANQRIEAESSPNSFVDWTAGQINGCSLDITLHECDAASGGWGVDGVDCAGEWIPLEVVLGGTTAFQIGTRSAATVGFVRQFQVRILNLDDNEAEVACDTLVTEPGLGFS